ncbi:MAG: 30S ribosomal protein S8 [Flavobacteriia bacterium]|nr:MAG: 30S ribosomal protein S8 [Flavobacteriia bacterium]
MLTDPISDFLTRVRNALIAGHRVVEIPSTSLKENMTKILLDQGFIMGYKVVEQNPQNILKIALKYDKMSKASVIQGLKRVSRPGLRQYKGAGELPRVKNGLGVAIVSTSKGVMSDKQARKENVGGEVLCYVY